MAYVQEPGSKVPSKPESSKGWVSNSVPLVCRLPLVQDNATLNLFWVLRAFWLAFLFLVLLKEEFAKRVR